MNSPDPAPYQERPIERQELAVAGLTEAACIIVDRWGIPHIRANSMWDLFVAQGFNAARDRLWQIDLWRKRGLGLLANDFGPGYLEQDRAARLFLYRGDMTAEWACYGPDARMICEAFVTGINAYIDLVAADHQLPVEFHDLGTEPLKWRVEDVVRIRSHSWMRNAVSEVLRANVLATEDAKTDLLRQHLDPPKIPEIAEGLGLESIPIEVLDLYKLAVAPVSFSKERLAATLDRVADWRKVMPDADVVRQTQGEGSNNWVIAGRKTDTGRPILANDPHRAHALPSLRYLVHLQCPEFDGIGAGEPATPGMVMGHNGTSAFGLTLFFGVDAEDVYVYDIAPDNPDLYRYRDQWEPMMREQHQVSVSGHADQILDLRFTRHGPVIYQDQQRQKAYAIRSVWFEPGACPYMASLSSMRAKNFAQFSHDMKRWAVPAVNQVYADTDGTIGWVVAGYSPVRPNWDGLTPVPGDGRYEWQGYLRAGELPHRLNPAEGCLATANEQNVPQDWAIAAEKIGFEWMESSRAYRISDVLGTHTRHSLENSRDLQTDVTSMPARRLLAVLKPHLRGASTGLTPALKLLQAWDGKLEATSAEAALFEVWWSKHLRPGVVTATVQSPEMASLLSPGDPHSILSLLEHPSAWLDERPTERRDEILTMTLAAAYQKCVDRMGPDRATWSWGRLHHGYFEHPLTRAGSQAGVDVGPLPMGGSDSTPMNAMYRTSDFRVVLGASVRMILDVGGWDNSLCINAPGQSGDPRSPHFQDLAEKWSSGGYVPLLYTYEAVDKVATRRIDLVPLTESEQLCSATIWVKAVLPHPGMLPSRGPIASPECSRSTTAVSSANTL